MEYSFEFCCSSLNVNAKGGDGRTALHIAIGRRRIVMVEDLVANGADINIRDIKGRSPLMMAEESCYSDLYRQDIIYMINHSPSMLYVDYSMGDIDRCLHDVAFSALALLTKYDTHLFLNQPYLHTHCSSSLNRTSMNIPNPLTSPLISRYYNIL